MTEMQKKQTLGIAIASLICGCLFLIPFLGVLFSLTAIILGIISLSKINKDKEALGGNGLAIAGIVLGSIGVIIAIAMLGLFAAVAVPNLMQARSSANEALAESTLRAISTAAETYAAANGEYPYSEYDMVNAQPPYINKYYNNQIISGYDYSLILNGNGYSMVARPKECGVTGKTVFIMETGGNLISEDCGVEY